MRISSRGRGENIKFFRFNFWLQTPKTQLVEHFLFALVAADGDKRDDHSGEEYHRGENPCGRMSASHLEEQHRETPADNRLEHHHERSVKAPEFTESGSHGGKARHIEQDEQQISQHLETPQVEMRLHRLVRTFFGTFGFFDGCFDARPAGLQSR